MARGALSLYSGRSDDTADRALRPRHPTLLVGGGLIVAAVVALFSSVYRMLDPTAAGTVPTAILCGVNVVTAVAMLAHPRLRTIPVALAGLALLDIGPVVLQWSAAAPAGSRADVALLILPTAFAAVGFRAAVFRGQLGVASGVAALMLLGWRGVRPLSHALVETVVAVGVLLVGPLVIRQVNNRVAAQLDRLRAVALTDKLTGALNRRGLIADISSPAWRRSGEQIGVLSLDIDHFKWFNDTYGHTAGDEVLRRVCDALRQAAGE